MPKFIDISGHRYGRLTALEVCERGVRTIQWKCRCDCGRLTHVTSNALRRGNTRSCGCLRVEELIARSTTHGQYGTREYRSWIAAKDRCYNPKNKHFTDYGARGIVMCEHWLNDFAAFREDMGRCPPGHTLDRRNNDGPYSPDNCRWADSLKQANNTRHNHRLTFNGVTMTLAEWASELGIRYETVRVRFRRGWPAERVLETVPPQTRAIRSKNAKWKTGDVRRRR